MNSNDTKIARNEIAKSFRQNGVALSVWGGNWSSTEAVYIQELLSAILDRYEESHRFYHSIKHVKRLFELIDKGEYSKLEKDILQLVALFHDIIYDPKAKDNEVKSADFFRESLPFQLDSDRFAMTLNYNLNQINNMILETQYFKKEGSSPISVAFNKMDLDALINGSFNELLENEMDIFREYQCVEYPVYKKNRLVFLEAIKTHPLVVGKNDKNLDTLMEYVKTYVPNIGIYVGSFNPFHIGHRDILRKAEKLFDKVIIVRGINGDKPEIHNNSHLEFSTNILPYHEVVSWCSSTTSFVKHVVEYAKVTLIRGLRSGYDFSHEVNQLRFMEDMYGKELPVVFIPCDRKYDYISSSAIRSIQQVCKLDCKEYL
jgi:pantetheine-phosphate adenylyltransferase